MWKVVSVIACCAIIVTSIWFYGNHQQNESAAFEHAKEFVIEQYDENKDLINGGIRYDIGRGNYFVIVQNDKTDKKHYLEVKIGDDLSLVSISDDSSFIE